MSEPQGFHEDYRRQAPPPAGSDRSFGLVFAAVFGLVGLWEALKGRDWGYGALALAAIFLVLGLARPVVLAPLNRLWHGFGLLLHGVVNPLIMGLIFVLAVVPTALILRLSGKDPLRLKFDREARSYWVERRPPGPAPDTMRHQF